MPDPKQPRRYEMETIAFVERKLESRPEREPRPTDRLTQLVGPKPKDRPLIDRLINFLEEK